MSMPVGPEQGLVGDENTCEAKGVCELKPAPRQAQLAACPSMTFAGATSDPADGEAHLVGPPSGEQGGAPTGAVPIITSEEPALKAVSQLPKGQRDILVACGVRVDEKPNFPLNILINRRSSSPNGSAPVSDYAMIPLNYYDYLRKVNEMAGRNEVKFHVWMAGINRLVRQYGVETSRIILTDRKSATPEQADCLDKLLKLERIREEVSKAIAIILGLNNFGGVISPMRMMMSGDPKYMEYVLDIVTKLMRDVDDESLAINFFQEQNASRLIFEDALRKALPKHRRERDDYKENLRYPATEAAIVRGLIEHGMPLDISGGVRYVSPGTGDLVRLDGGQSVPIAACLREAVCNRWLKEPEPADLKQYWDIDSGLGGFASNPNKSGEPLSVDPYYVVSNDVDPADRQLPKRIIANPWPNTWFRRITVGDGGGIGAQTQHVMTRMVNPILRQYLGTGTKRAQLQIDGLLRTKYGHVMDEIREWRDGSRYTVPQIDLGQFADLLRGMCEAVGAEARKHLIEDGTLKE